MLRSNLCCHGIADSCEQLLIPGRCESHRLRIRGCRTEPRHAVQRLGAGVERGQSKPFDGWGELVQEGDLLLECEVGQQRGGGLAVLPGLRVV
jgi:hypothetical protein